MNSNENTPYLHIYIYMAMGNKCHGNKTDIHNEFTGRTEKIFNINLF